MANRKEYEMLFALNASLNGNFQGTFSKAQQEFSKLGKEIQDLQKLQANVSSYQKQEQAIASTTTKLSNLQQQHNLLQREINETAGSTAGLEREKLRLEQRIKSTEEALERQKQKLDATRQKLQEAGVDTADLAQADARLAEQIKELQVQQDKAAESAASFGERAAQGIEAASGAIIASGIIDTLSEIKDAYLECVTVAADFQEGMSNVEALSSSTAQEMAELTAKAKELGAETKYTALESSEAMGYMAMAGWNAQQMLDGMSGVIDLAAASGEDLAMVSDIVTDNLTAFGLTAADTAHFADVLAAAATSSNTSIGIMGETFKQSASVAGALKYSIEDVAVATGLMANAGVKGSIGGTALKNTFNGLLEGVTLTSRAFGEYEYSAVRADGTMKDFAGTIGELRVYFDQMTEAERVNNAMAIAGQHGYNGLLAILNATDEDYASLTNSINNCSGAAQRMAGIKMDNLNGQLALMNSAWEAVQTTIGEQFNPELRELAGLGTDVLGWVNGFIQENPALVKGVTVFVGVLGTAVAALTAYAAIAKVVQVLNLVSLFTGPAGAVLGVAAGVGALAAAMVGLNEAAKVSLDESWELTASSREQYERLQELNAEYDRTVEQLGEASYEAQSLKWQIEGLSESYENGRRTFEEYRAAHEAVMDSYRAAVSARDEANASLEGEAAGTRSLIGKLAELTATSASAAENQDAIRVIVDRLNEALPDLNLNYSKAAAGSKEFIDSLMDMAQAEADAKKQAQDYDNYVDALARRGTLEAEKNSAAEQVRLAQKDYEAALKAYDDALKPYQSDPSGLTAVLNTQEEAAAYSAAREQLETYNTILKESTAAYEENEAAIAKLEGTFQDYRAAQEEEAAAAPTLEGAIASVRTQIEQLAAAYNDAYTAAGESISGQYSLWDTAAEVAATSASSINAALESQLTYWENYNANLASLGERSADIAGLSDMIATFADGSENSVNAIAGMANASDEDLRTMVSKWQELQEQQSETAESLAGLVTGFPEQMDALVTAMEEGVEGMSMPDEAQESARSTIQAFIDEADTMLPVVQDAYAQLGQAAARSLGIHDVTARKYDPAYINQYASGTSNAPPGWAWVGEEGPELMRMRGGETILPADVSREYAQLAAYGGDMDAYTAYDTAAASAFEASAAPGGSPVPITVEVHIHLEGNAAPETVQVLEDYVRRGELQEAVEDAIANIRVDTARGAYV